MNGLNPPQYEFLDLIRFAYAKGASDIHVEPTRLGINIRARINGLLTDIKQVESDRVSTFSENIKSLLGFDMAKFGVPQDSRFAHPEVKVDCRANLVGSLYGEKLCLRLLERDKDFHLANYPLESPIKDQLFRLVKKSQGLIIVSGPTGSGKSTLLYSVMGSIDRKVRAVYTIEDPVEYSLSNLIQIPIIRGVRFADALRALMRQDPDVIMVGEIRDRETAEAAVHAANTGHLVLTTVHANSASEVMQRISSLGVPEDQITSALLFASTQRLPKKLCQHCIEDDEKGLELARHVFGNNIDFVPKKSTGCDECSGLGISGRILIFEHIFADSNSGKKQLHQSTSLKKQALQSLRKGLINADEAYCCFND